MREARAGSVEVTELRFPPGYVQPRFTPAEGLPRCGARGRHDQVLRLWPVPACCGRAGDDAGAGFARDALRRRRLSRARREAAARAVQSAAESLPRAQRGRRGRPRRAHRRRADLGGRGRAGRRRGPGSSARRRCASLGADAVRRGPEPRGSEAWSSFSATRRAGRSPTSRAGGESTRIIWAASSAATTASRSRRTSASYDSIAPPRAWCSPMLPVAQIAADEGFADQSHFTQAFRRHVGVTPARYRRLARAQGNGFLSPPVTRET